MDPPMIRFSNDITNEFHDACVNGELDKVCNLLREKELIDVKQLEEKDTLCISVKEGHEKVVKILLQIGLDANKEPNMSPLQWAIIFSGNFGIVKSLLEHGANVHHQNSLNLTPLHYACLIGRFEITKELLKYNPDINAVCQDNGLKTPLMLAAEMGNSDVVVELLNHGADVDFKDSDHGTALHLATQWIGKNVKTVKTLLKYGCNTNVRAKLSAKGDALPMCSASELALKMNSINIVKTIAFHVIN